MKNRLLAAIAVGGVLALLPGCTSDGTYVSAGASYGYGGYHRGYYDNFYGPVRYGYWGPDNYFYYSTVVSGPFIRDEGRHFRRDRFEQARPFRMRGRPMTAENRRSRRERRG